MRRSKGAPNKRSASASISGLGAPVDSFEQYGAFVGAVHRKPLPIAALPQIGKKTGAVFMKMQKRPALHIEYSRPLLDETGSRPETNQQVTERLESACRRMLHLEAP
jgi:hypothetical protein